MSDTSDYTSDIDRFLDAIWMERGLSQNTLAAYRRDLTGFALWLSNRELGKKGADSLLLAQRKDLQSYLASRMKSGSKPRSTARLLSSLRGFYQYGVFQTRNELARSCEAQH